MSIKEKFFPKKIAADWVPKDAGYELTTSTVIIKSVLSSSKKERNFITLFHEGYQSLGTLIEKITDTECVIGKPKDWPGTHTKIRLTFKNRLKIAHHFYARVASTTRNSLHLELPQKMYRLQRRSDYRVDLPQGSIVTFVHYGKKCKCNIKDVSLSGILMYTRTSEELPDHLIELESITVDLPLTEKENTTLKIKKGELVRKTYNKRHGIFYYGIHCFPTDKEEEHILKFIRERELYILRKKVNKK
ncbi:MAG: PilZ domain-containing protein [Desulfobulbaceae bacterium]|uniref:PilZ domain-containing protein n=1 Tax=Candidatus Desulfobia pelagia TaxID=2841692 RepID=A0A8J6TD30_9BACT|nr:PilZ domain-containing protein [Candidatus Desulfobia pelagia]